MGSIPIRLELHKHYQCPQVAGERREVTAL
jgi:hypothetical protein